MQEKLRRLLGIANLRKVRQRFLAAPLKNFRVTGREQGDGSRLHGMLLRVVSQDDIVQLENSFEIETDPAQPGLAKNEQPWIFAVLLGQFPSASNHSKHLAEPAQTDQTDHSCA